MRRLPPIKPAKAMRNESSTGAGVKAITTGRTMHTTSHSAITKAKEPGMTEWDEEEALYGAAILWMGWFLSLIAVLHRDSSTGLMIVAGLFPLNLAACVWLFWDNIRRWMQRRGNDVAPPE
jgi:hypothetical protein